MGVQNTNHHNSAIQGLSSIEVEERRNQFGKNILVAPEKIPLWKQFLEKFTDPIIIILLIAMCLSFVVGCYHYFYESRELSQFFEPLGVLIAVLLATGISFFFEWKSRKEFDLLQKADDDTIYKVIRNGKVTSTPKEDIVVGDVVLLETGEEVPADAELLEAVALMVDESSLTGEPIATKSADRQEVDKEATYPMYKIYKGTTVVDGHCICVVTSVGMSTEYGKVYEGAQMENNQETPLNKQLNGLAKMITKVSYVIAILVVLGSIWLFYSQGRFQTETLSHFFSFLLNKLMVAITIIVVAVPEGLPMSVSLALAYSMRRMMKTNNLVRTMQACETMGATTVICTDKTGTLTQNRMKVVDKSLVTGYLDGDGMDSLLSEAIAVNSTAHLQIEDGREQPDVLGNPTEGALLLWMHQCDVDYLTIRENVKVLSQLTFSTERKYMATVVHSNVLNKTVLYVKGAPEVVMGYCPADDSMQKEYAEILGAYQDRALRTIAFGYVVLEEGRKGIVDGRIEPGLLLKFMGVVGIEDSIRTDVTQAIYECQEAGIDIRIITGDTAGTVKEIGRQLGLWKSDYTDENIITGESFASLSDEEAAKRIEHLKIMCRARPLDKERFVRLLQQKGEVVAVTGDGTNDAPALKRANVGLSMGDGTAVAKGASDITILDNSFSSIVNAVMWGRSLYLNIQRFILFQMTINVAACIIVLLESFIGTELPLTVTQMLWVNLIMDTFAALALASLPPSREVMKNKPRSTTASIISRGMAAQIIGIGLLFVVLLMGVIQCFKHLNITEISSISCQDWMRYSFDFSNSAAKMNLSELSIFFSLFVFLQFWNMFNAKAYKSGHSAFYQLSQCKNFLFIALVIAIGQWIITTVGGNIFSVKALSGSNWLWIVFSTSFVLWFGELARWLLRLADRR